ncbi:virulence protein SciE type [Sphingomonas gilva]|uniref:Virulence protein SciE type n=1 Tax=Sphingomonas gilva TaxID=2305907 RepID=A0A396S0X4_9SPHN|nr:type VI secretion system accessory protein TagJ [Sphingomonas gilva]RHW17015.1 virulence protein SciE type [Sphingomonas gilva]
MEEADRRLRDGDLDGARAALIEVVRAKPADQQARMFLFQLLALAGEWDKARTHLNMLAQLSPEAQMLSVAYGQAIEAERLRADVFAGRQPMIQLDASDWAQGIADAITHFAAGRTAEGEAARDAAFEAAPDMRGSFNDVAFDWIADGDGRFGPTFEAIVGGRYGIIPFDKVERIESEGPKDLRDVMWYPVQIALTAGQTIAAMLPARYPGTEASGTGLEKLGRGTSWREEAWGEAGVGQRLWTTSDGEDHPLLDLRLLTIEQG